MSNEWLVFLLRKNGFYSEGAGTAPFPRAVVFRWRETVWPLLLMH